MSTRKPTYYEFFAGGGMVRAAFDPTWRCLFANDISAKKGAAYVENWGSRDFKLGDVETLNIAALPSQADLAWASFPCQDLSLAGAGAGLKGKRSGVFWGFWRLMEGLINAGRPPSIIVLENVVGILTSHAGRDFRKICAVLQRAGYRYGALVIDAVHFVPQSRPRVFIIASRIEFDGASTITSDGPTEFWTPPSIETAYDNLSSNLRKDWVWWNLPAPKAKVPKFSDVIEHSPNSVGWDTQRVTSNLLAMMSPINRAKVRQAQKAGGVQVGTLYRRTRVVNGERVQRAEVRFDDIAGCLRTPAGGSSRQRLLVVNGRSIRSRLISSRETARLMGLPDTYILPENYNDAYHLTGDGVVTPAVAFLRENILDKLVRSQRRKLSRAA